MGNSGWTADPNTIVIPANAGNGPRIVITSAPPESIGYPLAAAILFYWNATDYHYMGISDFGDQYGYLVRGIRSETTGDDDHYEEIGYDNVFRTVNWERYLYDFINGGNYGEFNFPDEVNMFVDGVFLRDADNYKLNGISASAGSSTDEMQSCIGIDLTTGATGGVAMTTETVIQTLNCDNPYNNIVPQGNRRYWLHFMGRIRSSIANDRVRIRVRRTNATGTLIREWGDVICRVVGTGEPVDVSAIFDGVQFSNETYVLTAQRVAGTGNITYDREKAWAQDLVSDSMT